MEYRKVIGFGKSSYVVSLPKQWIEKHHLQKGDTIGIEEGTHELVLRAKERSTPQVAELKVIHTNGKDKSRIRSEIIAAYLSGFDMFKVIGPEVKQNGSIIRDTLNGLTGIEVLEQEGNKIIAKNLLNPEEISIPILVRRMDNIVRSMFSHNIEGAKEKVLDARDADVNRLFYLITRVMNSALDNPPLLQKLDLAHADLQRNMKVIGYLESLGDHMKRINRNISRGKLSEKERKKIREVLENLYKEYLQAMKAYHTGNKELAFETELHYKKRMDECNSVHKVIKGLPTTELVYNLKTTCASIKKIARSITLDLV